MPRASASRQLPHGAVAPEQGHEPRVLLGVLGCAELELPLDHPEHVHRDPRVERDPTLGRGHHVAFEVLAHRGDELGCGRTVVHRHPISSSRSHSISAIRRPSAASSTERTRPWRWLKHCISQITPHLSVPNVSQ